MWRLGRRAHQHPTPACGTPSSWRAAPPGLYVSYNLAVVREISDTVWVFTTAGRDDLPVS
jgi:hypothetical protein